MRYVTALAVLVGSLGAASAQDVPEITVRPLGGSLGISGYVGPYGRDLPGVSMFAGRATPVSPSIADGGVPLPTLQKLEDEYTYQDPLPILDGWRGYRGGGFPF